MVRDSKVFEPITIAPVEPYVIAQEIKLTSKDWVILDYLLEWGAKPVHEGGIARGATITDRAGRKIRSVTKKHVGVRCRYLEKVGLLKHVSKKPPRGAFPRTPHYYLNEDLEAFQLMVDLYPGKGDVMRTLTFMQSSYLYSALEKNITKLLVRWLIPDEDSDFLKSLVLLLIKRRIRRTPTDAPSNAEEKESEEEQGDLPTEEDGLPSLVTEVLDALESMPTEQVESELLSFFEEEGAFTEEQKSTYESIGKLSPAALHLMVFLPLRKLLEQYKELGLLGVLDDFGTELEDDGEQERRWRLLNRVMHKLLYHSMMTDLMRYPFLFMRLDKRELLGKLSRQKQ